jgi:hypothetical protein
MIKKIFLLFLCLVSTSCASYFLKQQCEKINWYQYGQEIAMRGDRVSNDDMVNQCRKAEAEMSESKLDQGFKAGMSKYCQPDTAFQTGKSGENLNMDLCDPGQLGSLKKRHAEGVFAYCKDGLSAGLSGKKYKNICNADLEKTFIPAYRQGRKKYLTSLVQINDSKLRDLNLEIDRLTYEKRISDGRLASIPYVKPGDQDFYANERQNLNDRSWQVSSQLNQKTAVKSQLDRENDEFKKELASLN